MPLSTLELAQAKDIAAELLEELRIEAFLFEIEPDEGAWDLHVECATGDGWQSLRIGVGKELLTARRDRAVRERLLREWRERLAECKKEGVRGGHEEKWT